MMMTLKNIFTCCSFLMAVSASIPGHGQTNASNGNNAGIKTADSFFLAGNWASAKALYDAAAASSQLAPISWSRLGFSNYQLGNYDEAMKDYQKVMAGNLPVPMKGLTFSRMAKIAAIKNETGKALTLLDSATNNSYGNLAEMDSLKDFNSIRNNPAFQAMRQKVYAVAYPCMVNQHAREFDFWIGEWDVYTTGTKNIAGHSLIQMISNGCALLENWDTPAGNGKSINYIDPTNNKWKQAWVGSNAGGTQEFVNGEYKDGAMRFVFETTNAQGQKIMGRFIFYNEKPGQVRQFNETSADGGKTWVTSYDFTYIRKR